MVKVEFTKKYANKKVGDTGTYDSMLARTLFNLKVAKEFKVKSKRSK